MPIVALRFREPRLRHAALAAAALLVASGCGRHDPSAVSFAIGGTPSELQFWEGLMAEFTGQTGVQVELIPLPSDSELRRQGIAVPLNAGLATPDVFLMDVVWVPQFAASNWLMPFDRIPGSAAIDSSAFFREVIEQVDTFHGRLLALPVYVDGGVLFYRTDLLARYGYSAPPETWDELLTTALDVQRKERVTNPGFSGFVWQGAQYEGLVCTWLEFAASGNGGFAFAAGYPMLDGSANVRALQFMQDIIHRQAISPVNTFTEMREEEVRVAFQRGDALFERNWPYAWPLHQEEGSPVRGKVGIAPLPRFAGGRSVAALGGWHVGISHATDAPQDSLRLVQFIASPETQKKLAVGLAWNPGRTDVYGESDLLDRLPHLAQPLSKRLLIRPSSFGNRIVNDALTSVLVFRTYPFLPSRTSMPISNRGSMLSSRPFSAAIAPSMLAGRRQAISVRDMKEPARVRGSSCDSVSLASR